MHPSSGRAQILLVVGLMFFAGCGSVVLHDPTGSDAEATGESTTETQPANEIPKFNYINAGQSVSALIVSPDRETMLVDTGHYNDDVEYVLEHLQVHDITGIDHLVTSYNDADHIGRNAAGQSDEVTADDSGADITPLNVTIDDPADGATLNASIIPNASANKSQRAPQAATPISNASNILNASANKKAFNWKYSITGAANKTVDDTTANGTTTLNETLTLYEINGAENITVYAEDAAGNIGSDKINITGDVSVPIIEDLTVSNPDGQNVSVTFNSNEELDSISVNISRVENATLTEGNFTETNGTYTATYDGSSNGTYSAILETAEDAAGNDGAAGQSDEVTVDPADTPDTTVPSISNFTVSNPESQNVSVSFNSSKKLDNITLNISGAENATLTKDDFTHDATTGTYSATYEGSSNGTYTAALDPVGDAADNGGRFVRFLFTDEVVVGGDDDGSSGGDGDDDGSSDDDDGSGGDGDDDGSSDDDDGSGGDGDDGNDNANLDVSGGDEQASDGQEGSLGSDLDTDDDSTDDGTEDSSESSQTEEVPAGVGIDSGSLWWLLIPAGLAIGVFLIALRV